MRACQHAYILLATLSHVESVSNILGVQRPASSQLACVLACRLGLPLALPVPLAATVASHVPTSSAYNLISERAVPLPVALAVASAIMIAITAHARSEVEGEELVCVRYSLTAASFAPPMRDYIMRPYSHVWH